MITIDTYCFGGNCPIKENCLRFKARINVKKHYHFAKLNEETKEVVLFAPYDDKKKSCGFYIGKNGDGLLNNLQDIVNGSAN